MQQAIISPCLQGRVFQMVSPKQASNSDLNQFESVITRMCNGDIKAFVEARRLMDDLDFLLLSNTLVEQQFFALYICRSFIENVFSNLAGDAMFEAPPDGTKLDGLFRKLASTTGKFLQELILSDTKNYSVAFQHLNHAIKLYFSYLNILNKIAETSDLGHHDHIWESEDEGEKL